VDHFKNFNNSGGHGFGDELLRIMARRLRSHIARSDLVLRFGGDEFVVIARVDETMDAAALAARVLAEIRAPIVYEDRAVSLTASIGAALYPEHALDAPALLKNAEMALHHAKESGRNCFRLFEGSMNTH
jgi:diguanylate cyclase (GGDEF)-like protein